MKPAVERTLPLFTGIEPTLVVEDVKKKRRKAKRALIETALAWVERRGKSFVDVWMAAHRLSKAMK